MTDRRPSPPVLWSARQVARGSKEQMKTWERLVKKHAFLPGVNTVNARHIADGIADQANQMGMFASDSLQLMISAVESWETRGNKDRWWEALCAGDIPNQANGLTLEWMPSQFTKYELVWFGRKAVELITRDDPDAWGRAEPTPASEAQLSDSETELARIGQQSHDPVRPGGVGYMQGTLPTMASGPYSLRADDEAIRGRGQREDALVVNWTEVIEFWTGEMTYPDFFVHRSGHAVVLILDPARQGGYDLVVNPDDLDVWLAELKRRGIKSNL